MSVDVLDAAAPAARRTPAKRKARELAKHLRGERPDYTYLKEVFRYLRTELDVEVATTAKRLPFVPSEEQLRAFYEQVWQGRRGGDIVLIKTLLYTGVRVAEVVRIRIDDVDLDAARIRITDGKGGKDRYVPFPASFRETLALHIDARCRAGGVFLFESSWKKPYTDRGVRKIVARYCAAAGITQSISPHKLRHFLFTWLKAQGVDDAHIQPYSGHETRQSLEIYSRMSLATAQASYEPGHRPIPCVKVPDVSRSNSGTTTGGDRKTRVYGRPTTPRTTAPDPSSRLAAAATRLMHLPPSELVSRVRARHPPVRPGPGRGPRRRTRHRSGLRTR